MSIYNTYSIVQLPKLDLSVLCNCFLWGLPRKLTVLPQFLLSVMGSEDSQDQAFTSSGCGCLIEKAQGNLYLLV